MPDREFLREFVIAALCLPAYATVVIAFFVLLDILCGSDIVLFN